jgi:tetratricopeptide (TPR) repeat protein
VISAPATSPPIDLLAYHFARSESADKAVVYLERAADSAQARHATASAEGYYRELIERLDAQARTYQSARAREKLGRSLSVATRYDAALLVLEEALHAYTAVGDIESQVRVTAQMGLVHARRRTPSEGMALLEPAFAFGEDLVPDRARAALSVALADLYSVDARYDEALAAAERAADLARQAGDRSMLASAELHRATALIALGHHDEGLQTLGAAIPQAEMVGDLTSLFNAFRSAVFVQSGRVYLERALEITRRLGDPVQITFMLTICRQNAWLTGDWPRAWMYTRQAMELLPQLGDSPVSAFCVVAMGVMYTLTGDVEAGAGYMQQAAVMAERTQNLYALLIARWILSVRDILEGRPDAARASLSQIVDRYGEEGAATFPPVLIDLAGAHLECGDKELARETIGRIHARTAAKDDRPSLVDVLRLRGRLAAAEGHMKQSDEFFQSSIALARAIPFPFGEGLTLYSVRRGARGARGHAAGHPEAAGSA